MRCSTCDHDNDDGASMCAGCGAYRNAPSLPDARPPLSEFAESALLLAIVSPFLAGLSALVALPLGVAGLVEVRRSRGRMRGTGHAIAAIIISLLVLVVTVGGALYITETPLPWECEDCQPPEMGMLLDAPGGHHARACDSLVSDARLIGPRPGLPAA